jgi:hypothetical protein
MTPATLPSMRILRAPKEGNAPEQYEDAYATTFDPDAPADRVVVALADGASSAVFARDWANQLAGAFANDAGTLARAEDDAIRERLRLLGADWREAVRDRATSWYAQEKLPQGSAAALLVVAFDMESQALSALSVGDVCVFLVRQNRLKYAFPITKSSAFDDRPALLSTELDAGAPCPKFVRFSIGYEPGDRFLLLTDAWAAYFLAEWEAKRKPWNELPANSAALPAYLKARRDDGKLKNDDVTLIDLIL